MFASQRRWRKLTVVFAAITGCMFAGYRLEREHTASRNLAGATASPENHRPSRGIRPPQHVPTTTSPEPPPNQRHRITRTTAPPRHPAAHPCRPPAPRASVPYDGAPDHTTGAPGRPPAVPPATAQPRLQHARGDVVVEQPLAQIGELLKAHIVVEPVVALGFEPCVLLEPCRGCE